MPQSELRRRLAQRVTLMKILESLELEPDPIREDRVKASLGELELRLEELRQAPKRRVAALEAELDKARRDAEEAARG